MMEFKNQVEKLLHDALEQRKDLFLIDFKVGSDQHIEVVLDGDEGVSVEDCVQISRAIEHFIDRDEHDFSLSVQSCGATTPLSLPRQFPKHLGRTLRVQTQNDTFEGNLIGATSSDIQLEWKERVPKEIGKGKQTVVQKMTIAFTDIVKAQVVLTF